MVISGGCGSHHFVTFGQHSFVGGLSGITRDVPPFMVVDGHPGIIRGVNRTGLKRRGFMDEQIDALKAAYRLLFRDTTPFSTQAVELQRLYPGEQRIQTLLAFCAMRATDATAAREIQRGKKTWDEDEEHQHVSGN